jgi:hypothetical protein
MASSPFPNPRKFRRVFLALFFLATLGRAATPDGDDGDIDYTSDGASPGPSPGSTVTSDGPVDVTTDGITTTYDNLSGVTLVFDSPAVEEAQTEAADGGVGVTDPSPPPAPNPGESSPDPSVAASDPAPVPDPPSDFVAPDSTPAPATDPGSIPDSAAAAPDPAPPSPAPASDSPPPDSLPAVAEPAAPLVYQLTTYAVGDGSVTPGGTYPANTTISVTASPGSNSGFDGWSGSASGSSNPFSVTMNADIVLYANFVANPASAAPANGAPSAPVPVTPAISRIRFNATGRDSHIVNQNATVGSSFIWTDPNGLQRSPWPAFSHPQPAVINTQNTQLPAAPSPPP